MSKPARPPISPESIDKLVAAGATAEVVAKIGKGHLPELASDIDILTECGASVVAGFIKAELQVRHDKVNRYNERHAAHMRKVRADGAKKPPKASALKRASEPELPLDSEVSQVSQVSRGLTGDHEAHPPVPPPGPSPLSPRVSDPDGSVALSARAKAAGGKLTVLSETPNAKLWHIGSEFLMGFGKSEREARALIGHWLKTNPNPAGILDAIEFARDRNVAEPVAYITTLVNEGSQHGTRQNGGGGFALNALEFARRSAECYRTDR
jgi:hypothetical protein